VVTFDGLVWGLRGGLSLLRDLNCALATLEVVQDMAGIREDISLRAATGLEGGLVACGSTCGVITGGALGIALMRAGAIDALGERAQRMVMTEVRDYVHWFRDSFDTTTCRERTGVDFYRVSGQLRYLLPGDRVARCLWHTGRAVSYLRRYGSAMQARPCIGGKDSTDHARHCAIEVLRGVRRACGMGDEVLEKIAFVFDGGVAFTGGVCGALAGAVMAANLAFGWDIRSMGRVKSAQEFVGGHLNLLRKGKVPGRETFAVGREIMKRLTDTIPALECARITSATFRGWDDFQSYMHTSNACRELIAQAAKVSSEVVVRRRNPE